MIYEICYTYISSNLNCSVFNCSEVKRLEQRKSELLTFLRQGNNLIDRLINEAAARWQLSASEIQLLLYLDQMPHLNTARDAAQYCGMSKASVSGNVLKLATRGLLTVDVDLKDRRFQHLALTEQASPILSDVRSVFQRFDSQMLEALNADEQEQFLTLLSKISADSAVFSIKSDTGKDQ